MKVTIIRGDEWHKHIEKYRAEQITHCKGWKIDKAIEREKPLLGWKITKEDE